MDVEIRSGRGEGATERGCGSELGGISAIIIDCRALGASAMADARVRGQHKTGVEQWYAPHSRFRPFPAREIDQFRASRVMRSLYGVGAVTYQAVREPRCFFGSRG